jgi:rubrerythrin
MFLWLRAIPTIMTIQKQMTKTFVENAFAGESKAHMCYLLFADRAEEDGLPNIARLFRAIAYAELVHARNHLRALGSLSDTVQNLQHAVDGETFEVEEMYEVYKHAANLQGEQQAETFAHYALEAEKIHAQLYATAQQQAHQGTDMTLETLYVCPVCGYTAEGEAPDFCPVCGAPRKRFAAFVP